MKGVEFNRTGGGRRISLEQEREMGKLGSAFIGNLSAVRTAEKVGNGVNSDAKGIAFSRGVSK